MDQQSHAIIQQLDSRTVQNLNATCLDQLDGRLNQINQRQNELEAIVTANAANVRILMHNSFSSAGGFRPLQKTVCNKFMSEALLL